MQRNTEIKQPCNDGYREIDFLLTFTDVLLL